MAWLENVGQDEVILIDHASSYEPLLDFYATTPHRVVRLKDNLGPQSLWTTGALDEWVGEGPYVFTDPDIVPAEECPDDALDHFADILARYPKIETVGFGLKIDDLPDRYRFKRQVQIWESQFWRHEVEPGVFDAPIDTTFALYRPGAAHQLGRSLRTGAPYLARHTAWYVDSERPTREDSYYSAHARADITHWDQEKLPPRKKEAIRILMKGNGKSLSSEDARLQAWTIEPRLRDETEFTKGCEPGWSSWNDMSPELEFCELASLCVRLLRPQFVIETGVGQGFVTRRLLRQLGPGQRLLAFEEDPDWRESLRSLEFFQDPRVTLSDKLSPTGDELRRAQVTILDSDFPVRFDEVRRWASAAAPGSLLIAHDCGNQHPPDTGHAKLRRLIEELRIPGLFLRNPRGGFVGLQDFGSDRMKEFDAHLQDDIRQANAARLEAQAAQQELNRFKASRSFRYTGVLRRSAKLVRNIFRN